MTYDVPVKLFAFHLVVMSVWLLAPHLRRLAGAFFPTGAFSRRSAILQAVLGVCAVAYAGMSISFGSKQMNAPKPALYGIWSVDVERLDGVERPPLLSDPRRWRYVVIERPQYITFWSLDNVPKTYTASYDTAGQAVQISIGKTGDALTVSDADPYRMTLDGSLQGFALHLEARRLDLNDFPLLSTGFHWVQQYPVNR